MAVPPAEGPVTKRKSTGASRFHHDYGVEEPLVRWRALFQEGRAWLTVGVLLVEFLVAVQALVVTAIMPAVERDLGGLAYYGLAFSGFSIAALVAAPTAGRASDRRGPATPFLLFGGVFIAGTLLAGVAPSMPLLALTRVLQGYGAGGWYTVALVAIARTYPESGRARMLALLAGAWIVPGLLGPSYGALMASTVGWRWAFVSIVPLIVLPALRALPAAADPGFHLGLRWPLQLAAGVAALVAGLSLLSWFSVPLVFGGVWLTWLSLGRILPAGSLRVASGLPAAVVTIFLLIFAFIAGDYFIPLLLTGVRGRSLTEAGIVITLGTVSWSLGNWWQARVVGRWRRVDLGRLGTALLLLALLGISATLISAPLMLAYSAWLLAGIGMGIAYPTAYLVIMEGAGDTGTGSAVSSGEVSERLALALAGGIGGASVALAEALRASLAAGLAGAFGLAIVAAVLALAITGRLDRPI
jgi:MFS family permease